MNIEAAEFDANSEYDAAARLADADLGFVGRMKIELPLHTQSYFATSTVTWVRFNSFLKPASKYRIGGEVRRP